MQGPPREVVQGSDASHHGREGGGDSRIARVGPVLLALDGEFVDLGVEGVAHQPRRAGKLDDGAARPHAVDLETLGGEPVGHGLDVRIGGAEPLSKLFGRKPLVIVGRGLDVLLIQQLPQLGFLVSTALEDEQHAPHGQAVRGRAAVVLRARQRMRVSPERHDVLDIHRLCDARGNLNRLGGNWQSREEHGN